jgi:Fe2+ or Zn2+ uptake regulation protein
VPNVKLFASLMQSIDELAYDLNLADLTDNDQKVYAAIVLLAEDKDAVDIRDLLDHSLTVNVAVPTVYRSLKTLIQQKKIKRVGTVRSGSYDLS